MPNTTITSTTAFLSTYAAQVAGSLAIAATYFLVPLRLGPRRYSEFIALVGIGFLAPALIDQILNAVLAFNVGRGNRTQLSGIVLSKVIAATVLAGLCWIVISRSGLVLAFSAAFAIAFVLSTTLDTWLIASGRTLFLAVYKVLTTAGLAGALVIATRQGPGASAATLLGYYLIGSAGCIFVLVREFERPRLRVSNLAGLGAAGPLVWFPVYSWLLPLVLLSAGHPVAASNTKLAVAFTVGLALFAPVPASLLTVAMAAQRTLTADLAAAVRRTIVLALFAGIVGPVALFANYGVFAAILSHFGYLTAAPQAVVASLALFPLLANPMLCARVYAADGFAWSPVAAYVGMYSGTIALAAVAPGIAAALIPVGHWLLFCLLAFVNRDLLTRVTSSNDIVRVAVVASLALLLVGTAVMPDLTNGPIRLVLTAALCVTSAWLALPYLRDESTLKTRWASTQAK